jgi:hypothetical protein
MDRREYHFIVKILVDTFYWEAAKMIFILILILGVK